MPDDRETSQGEPISYRAGKDDVSEFSPGMVFGTALAVTAGLVSAVAVLLFFAFAMDYKGEGQRGGVKGQLLAGTLLLTIVFALVFTAIRWKRSPASREKAIGIWIGLGVALLIEGVCFLANSR